MLKRMRNDIEILIFEAKKQNPDSSVVIKIAETIQQYLNDVERHIDSKFREAEEFKRNADCAAKHADSKIAELLVEKKQIDEKFRTNDRIKRHIDHLEEVILTIKNEIN